MAIVLNLPPQAEREFLAEARARGVSVDELLLDVLLTRQSVSSMANLSPEEWVAEFRNWVGSHSADGLPLLSDDAISRDSIYRDRGL